MSYKINNYKSRSAMSQIGYVRPKEDMTTESLQAIKTIADYVCEKELTQNDLMNLVEIMGLGEYLDRKTLLLPGT